MALDPVVAGFVLLAALMHASWNAVVKSDTDRQTSLALVMLAGIPFGLALLPFAGGMGREAWIWLAASVLVHCLYYTCLLKAYRFGDLSQVYPIARGLGPLLVALASGFVFSETLTAQELTGVAIVSLGIGSLAFGGRHSPAENRHALVFAMLTGLCIASYTLIDARGVRAAEDPLAYIAWLNIVEAPWIALLAIATRGGSFVAAARRGWKRGLAGGFVAAAGYGISMYAFSRSGAAHVAALREVSVIFAAIIGAVMLGEGFGWRRVLAAMLVAGGLILMNWRA
ncbi:MAG TPA: EamA family transporter [Ferrovibrio sp.]|jgi:drug/metabolite transporter (DMT)-like permease|uniref:EamA family transporter n=1 Tax=Ferrovibrio sp. TaxID=1917215 RepID=UPI002B4B3A48|nr:EamA family transporter [Ferrovibrio sp.]HLT76064.1 EamA family transporter [Ferrovibrio sp.]